MGRKGGWGPGSPHRREPWSGEEGVSVTGDAFLSVLEEASVERVCSDRGVCPEEVMILIKRVKSVDLT